MLTSLLEIDSNFLKPEHATALGLAERAWAQAGKPSGCAQLIQFLEDVLTACEQNGHEYPPILLRRKKELIRGTWQPTTERAPSAPVSVNTSGKIPYEWYRASEANRRRELLGGKD